MAATLLASPPPGLARTDSGLRYAPTSAVADGDADGEDEGEFDVDPGSTRCSRPTAWLRRTG